MEMSTKVKCPLPILEGAERDGAGAEPGPPVEVVGEEGATEPEGEVAVLLAVTLMASFCPKTQWRS